jgi:hypothetical protein
LRETSQKKEKKFKWREALGERGLLGILEKALLREGTLRLTQPWGLASDRSSRGRQVCELKKYREGQWGQTH